MNPVREQREAFDGGGILYDAALMCKPEPAWFSKPFWLQRGALAEVTGGRGSVCFLQASAVIQASTGRWVWRHYRRGGLVAKVFKDRYLWTGEGRTRSFAEWRLLAELRRRGLPVPAPVAAAYRLHGLVYEADLITEELPASTTLAQALSASLAEDRWRSIGRTIARFHGQGVQHADLNAHNILLGDRGDVYVLDFDRGQLRERGSWEQQVLARLRRSLDKISNQQGRAFDPANWDRLMDGYRESAGR